MIPLPVCIYRSEPIDEGRHECAQKRLAKRHGHVTVGDCLRCAELRWEDGTGRFCHASQTEAERAEQLRTGFLQGRPESRQHGIITLAVRFTKAMISHALNGFRRASKETYESRVAICTGCKYLDQQNHRCGACGCGAGPGSLIDKLTLASSACDLGKWGPER